MENLRLSAMALLLGAMIGLRGLSAQTPEETRSAVDPLAAEDSSRAVTADSVPSEVVIPPAPTIDILKADEWDSAFAVLSRSGLRFSRSSVIAVGLRRHDSSLVLFTIDSLGGPAGVVRRVNAGQLAALGGTPLTRIAVRLPAASGPPALHQSGRVYFMIHTTVKAAGNYPQALSQAFPQTDGRVIAGVATLSIGASLYGSYLFTRKMELGYGKVAIMNCLGEVGIGVPHLLGTLIWARGAREAGDQIAGWGSMVGFPLGLWGGSLLKVVEPDEYGKAAVMRDFTRWAYLYGYLTPLLFDGDERDYFTASTITTMACMPAGFLLGKVLTRRGMSSGRSVLVLVTGTMGSLTGALAPDWFGMARQKPIAAATLAGHAAGTTIGLLMYRKRDYTFGQGVFIGASAAVGSAIALAVPLLAQSDEVTSYTSAGSVGAWGGLFLGELLSRALFERSGRDRQALAEGLLDRVSVPALAQIPLLAAGALVQNGGDRSYRADLLRVNF